MLNISSIEKYIALSEAKIHKLRPNIEKKILWAHKADQKTPISLVFIHGFSATRAELSPVIEQVGLALKANVFFTRLTGHGQDGVELSNATFENWISDTKEAISVGELIGDEVVLIGSSTGCSLIHALIEPGAKWFIPLILGKEHSFVAKNSEHERCWTTHYPTEALFAVKDSVVAASLANHKNIKLPMLFWFSDNDKVVSAKDTRKIISKMGRNVEVFNPILSPNDDPSKHGVLGDILSPTKTAQGVRKIIEWIKRNN